MAYEKTQIGSKDDGSPIFHYTYLGQDGDVEGNTGGLLLTGPITGTITLSDGTHYDVSPEVIEHAPGHAGAIVHHIDKLHEENGGLPVGPNMIRQPFVHFCTDQCGTESTPAG